jgi:hypothetical protein
LEAIAQKLPGAFSIWANGGFKKTIFNIKIHSDLVTGIQGPDVFLDVGKASSKGFVVGGCDWQFVFTFQNLGNTNGNLFASEGELNRNSIE